MILFSLAAVPNARWDNKWSAGVYRVSTMAGIAMKLGIRNDTQVSEISDSDPATTYRVVDEMRNRHLGMFADASNMRVGEKIVVGASQLTVPAKATPYHVDSNGTLIGRAAFTNAGSKRRNGLRLGIPTLSGFHGYAMQTGVPAALVARESDGTIKEVSRLQLQQ